MTAPCEVFGCNGEEHHDYDPTCNAWVPAERCPEAGCPFCRETAGSQEVAELLDDVYPSAPNHRLIVPTRHVSRVADLTRNELSEMWRLASLTVRFQQDDCDGFTIGINDGEAAGQTVPHVHLHVIPRRLGDVPDPRGGIRWVLPQTAPYWVGTSSIEAPGATSDGKGDYELPGTSSGGSS